MADVLMTGDDRHCEVMPLSGCRSGLQWTGGDSFTTQRLGEAQRHLRALKRDTLLGVQEPDRFEGFSQSAIRINEIMLSRTAIRSPDGYSLDFRPQGQYCLNIPQMGRGWISSGAQLVELSVGRAVLVAPGHVVHKQWLGPSDVLSIHIPSRLILETGVDRALGIAPLAVVDEASVAALVDLLSGICGTSSTTTALLDPSVSPHIERAIVALLVRGLGDAPCSEATAQLSRVVPYYVRRAEMFMRANFRPGVTLDDIAAAAGVSRRSLQYGFRRYHQMTPMHFFRKIRLEYARGQLLGGGWHVPLTQLAWDVGYQNSSHFGSDYRAVFGEAPSQTLTRMRHRADPTINALQ